MSILAIGTIAYDDITTPVGSKKRCFGGSATYFALAGTHFTNISIISIVGDDFEYKNEEQLLNQGIDISSIEREKGKCFHWSGTYDNNFDTRKTNFTHLNVLENFNPIVSQKFKGTKYLFLGNIDPDIQLSILQQLKTRPKIVALDTMNYWIETKNTSLLKVIANTDVLFLDSSETRMLGKNSTLIGSAKKILDYGPSYLVVKRGEHGASLVSNNDLFSTPTYPTEQLVDPTGAGDSFAGGFMGYLASVNKPNQLDFRKASVMGCVMGSFAIEDFGPSIHTNLTQSDILKRYETIKIMSNLTKSLNIKK